MDRWMSCAALLTAGLAVAACTSALPSQPPTVENGVQRYSQSRVSGSVPCARYPVLLTGNRTELHLTGACETVTVAGARNDIIVDIVPGGTIDITGAHNDVTWRKIGEGPDPTLKITGPSNTYHRG